MTTTALIGAWNTEGGIRRVASQFFLVSPDSQVDEALADPIIFFEQFFIS